MKLLYTIPSFPVFMGCVGTEPDTDICHDLNFKINKNGLLQIHPIPKTKDVYMNSHNSGKIGSVWKVHHELFAKFINKYKPNKILEIGAGHGILSEKYFELDSDIIWQIIEPNPSLSLTNKATLIKKFFNKKIVIDNDTDSIVHSHVFEHVKNPDKFIETISEKIIDGNKMFFSVPNMRTMLERQYLNFLNFEHTFYLHEDYIDFLMAKHKFKIIEKHFYLEDHSIFYAVVKDANVKKTELNPEIYDETERLFQSYITNIENTIKHINQCTLNTTQPVYIFGGHIFSQLLIKMGLDINNVKGILDNDKEKWGKRLYGTNLIVHSPEILRENKNPLLICHVGPLIIEVKNQIHQINPSTSFI